MLLPTLLASLAPAQDLSGPAAQSPYQLVTDEVTVVLADRGAAPETWLASQSDPVLSGLSVLRANHLGIVDLRLPPGASLESVLDALDGAPGVAVVERVWRGAYFGAPNDPQFASQDHLLNTGQTGGAPDADCDAERAWDITTGDPSIIIAVIDSGTEITHPDLQGNVWNNADEIPSNGIDDDGNGFVDDAFGWSFENNNPNPAGGSHGTWVGGVISARTNNGIGVAGLAGGWGDQPGCSMMALGIGGASPISSLFDDAIVYAADNGARVITLSLTVPQSAALDSAIDYARNTKGVFIDCASGNGFFGGGPVTYPATNANVVAVGGTTHDDVWWGTANFGPEVRVAAQAENVYTTAVGNSYAAVSGTSFAAPQVGALAGLVLSVNPSLTPDQLLFVLGGAADDVEAPGIDTKTGLGRINAWRSVLAALEPDCNGNGLIDGFEIVSGAATDADGDGLIDDCQSLFPGLASVSVSGGGDLALTLDAGPAQAGDAYFLVGSMSGVTPGVDLGGSVLPLVVDAYSVLSLESSGSAPFLGFAGTLDVNGGAGATFSLGAGGSAALVGKVLYHAYACLDPVTFTFDFASNPAAIELLP